MEPISTMRSRHVSFLNVFYSLIQKVFLFIIASSAEFSVMRKVLRNKLLHTHNKVEILQNDPSNPLYSAKSFEELSIPEEFLRGIYDMGFSKPSRIQEAALPILLREP